MIDLIIATIIAIPTTIFCLRKYFNDSFESSAYYEHLTENDEL